MKKGKSLEYRIAFYIGFIVVIAVGLFVREFADPSVLKHDAWEWLSSLIAIINGVSLISHTFFPQKIIDEQK